MPVAYDRPGGGSTTRAPKPVRRIKAKKKPPAPPRNADTGDPARSRPAPRPRPAPPRNADTGDRTRSRPAPKPTTRPKAKPRADGPFTKTPVKGMLDAERRAVEALSALHDSDES